MLWQTYFIFFSKIFIQFSKTIFYNNMYHKEVWKGLKDSHLKSGPDFLVYTTHDTSQVLS